LTSEAIRELVPTPPLEHDTEVWYWDMITVDRVDVAAWQLPPINQVGDDLVTEQVEVNPPRA